MTKERVEYKYPTTVNLNDEILDALKTRLREIQSEHPGKNFTISDIIRSSIIKGLEADDQ